MYRAITAALLVPLLLLLGFACFYRDRAVTEQFSEERELALNALIAQANARHAASQDRGMPSIAAETVEEYFIDAQWERVFEYVRMFDELEHLRCPLDGKALPDHQICFDPMPETATLNVPTQ